MISETPPYGVSGERTLTGNNLHSMCLRRLRETFRPPYGPLKTHAFLHIAYGKPYGLLTEPYGHHAF